MSHVEFRTSPARYRHWRFAVEGPVATLVMDAGPILAQEAVPVLAGDTEATLHERIKVVERALYPATVAWALGELEAGRSIQPPAPAGRMQ